MAFAVVMRAWWAALRLRANVRSGVEGGLEWRGVSTVGLKGWRGWVVVVGFVVSETFGCFDSVVDTDGIVIAVSHASSSAISMMSVVGNEKYSVS